MPAHALCPRRNISVEKLVFEKDKSHLSPPEYGRRKTYRNMPERKPGLPAHALARRDQEENWMSAG